MNVDLGAHPLVREATKESIAPRLPAAVLPPSTVVGVAPTVVIVLTGIVTVIVTLTVAVVRPVHLWFAVEPKTPAC